MATRTPFAELSPENLNTIRSSTVRRGRKARALKDLISMGSTYKVPPPQLRTYNSVSPRKKIRIILYLLHHRIEEPEVLKGLKPKRRCLEGLAWDGAFRPPTLAETGAHFKVPPPTIQKIWAKRYKIVGLNRSQRRDASGVRGEQLPELELELFRSFVEWRHMGRKASRFWFQRKARSLYRTLYGEEVYPANPVSICIRFSYIS